MHHYQTASYRIESFAYVLAYKVYPGQYELWKDNRNSSYDLINFVSCRAVQNTIEAPVASRCHCIKILLQKTILEGDIRVVEESLCQPGRTLVGLVIPEKPWCGWDQGVLIIGSRCD